MSALTKCVSWSVSQALRATNVQMKSFVNASATCIAEACFRGIAKEYLVKRSWIVRMYRLPELVDGSGPIISIDILSKAAPGVSVRIIG